MTIAETDKTMKDLVNRWSVYGVEAVLNALARACKDHPYLQSDDLHRILDYAIASTKEDSE